MTASAVTSLSLHPVLLLVCVSTRLPTHEVLESTGRFGVNVLGESDSVLALRFATPGIDKFSGIGHTSRAWVPVLNDSIAYFVCDVHERLPGGDRSIFIGTVRQLGLRRGARPLLYFGSRFSHLAGPDDALLRAWLERPASV